MYINQLVLIVEVGKNNGSRLGGTLKEPVGSSYKEVNQLLIFNRMY